MECLKLSALNINTATLFTLAAQTIYTCYVRILKLWLILLNECIMF